MTNLSGAARPTTIQRFESRDDLDRRLAGEIAVMLREGIEKRGMASLVVSGGRTPVGFFECLSREPLEWSRVMVTLADERWVEPDSSDSNERLVRAHLLHNHAAEAQFVGLKNLEPTAEAGMSACQRSLAALPKVLDAVVLGMGEDGHTASFFPGAETLSQALDTTIGLDCIAVTPVTAPHQRMTLTLARLLNSRKLYLHLCGEAKLPVLDQALASGPVEQMPVRAILQQTRVPLAIYWAA